MSDDDGESRETVESVWIDRGTGSGALDATTDWNKSVTSEYDYANDGRSQTRTTFYWTPDDRTPHYLRNRDRHQLHRDPQERRDWDTLSQWNDGKRSNERSAQNKQADVERWIATFSTYCELTNYQQKRVSHVVSNVDMSKVGSLGYEAIILATITLVVDEDLDVDPDEWTPDDWIIYDEDFEQLRDDVNVSQQSLWTARKIVHSTVDSFSND